MRPGILVVWGRRNGAVCRPPIHTPCQALLFYHSQSYLRGGMALPFAEGTPKWWLFLCSLLKPQKKDTLKKDEPPMFLDMVNDPPKRTPGRPGFREHDLAQGCQQKSLVPVLRHG